jgi:hypothetical protein
MTGVGGAAAEIAKAKHSYTGQFLKPVLAKARCARASGAASEGATSLELGHGRTVLEVFLEPTCPFSKRAFEKLPHSTVPHANRRGLRR